LISARIKIVGTKIQCASVSSAAGYASRCSLFQPRRTRIGRSLLVSASGSSRNRALPAVQMPGAPSLGEDVAQRPHFEQVEDEVEQGVSEGGDAERAASAKQPLQPTLARQQLRQWRQYQRQDQQSRRPFAAGMEQVLEHGIRLQSRSRHKQAGDSQDRPEQGLAALKTPHRGHNPAVAGKAVRNKPVAKHSQ
jgi:hypothetical protein